MKILCVEDGSVDIDILESEGLKDGQILVYRQGARPPFVLSLDNEYYDDKWHKLKELLEKDIQENLCSKNELVQHAIEVQQWVLDKMQELEEENE